MRWPPPSVPLEGAIVRLEPIDQGPHDGLLAASCAPETWTWLDRCVPAEFKTDARNERSRTVLAALPATFEGVFRKHMLMGGIGVRDSAYFSIIDDEWPAVRANLGRRLAREPARA